MPSLHWIGKEKVVNHHHDVPYRVLDKQYTFSAEEEPANKPEIFDNQDKAQLEKSNNLIIHGDNLEALKALLPQYEGKVKCIYIDPPYNTGNECWVYNDNVNDPKLKKWLGQVVGKESEDLSRHDKWLCMMYPRLVLLQKLLHQEGMIFISIDDNEQANLRLVCNEIFGGTNFLANIAWEKRFTRSNNAKLFYSVKDSILVYRKSNALSYIREGRTEKADANYSNPDNDPRGVWMSSSYVNPATKSKRPNLVYELENPFTKDKVTHPTHAWKYKKVEYQRHVKEGKLYWGVDGGYTYPRLKNFLEDAKGMVPVDYWSYKEVGTTDDGGKTLTELFGEKGIFDTPKPQALIEKIIKISCNDDDIVLDSFAGSGTTAHAVLNLNKSDEVNRKFILIETEDYAEKITAERVRRVMNGYADEGGTGGNFDYYTLGERLFDDNGNLNPVVPTDKIRQYIWFTETKGTSLPITDEHQSEPYRLGLYEGTAYYFCYDAEVTTTLDYDLLGTFQTRAEQYIVYADLCLLPDEYLQQKQIIFKKIPRDITRL